MRHATARTGVRSCLESTMPPAPLSPPPTRYFGGTLLAQAAADAVTVSCVRYDRGTCRSHTHDRAFLALVTAGGYRERFGARTMSLDDAGAALHPAGTTHSDEIVSDRTTFLIVEAERGFAEAARERDAGGRSRSADPSAPIAVGPAAAGRLAELHLGLCRGRRLEPLVAESLAAEAFADGNEPVRPCRGPMWVARALDFINETSERTLSLRDLAAEVGLHPVYVSRAFRAHVGVGLAEARRQARVRRAISALAQGRPIADVALDCGFADQSHLTRAVRAVSGLTPGRWRRLGRAH